MSVFLSSVSGPESAEKLKFVLLSRFTATRKTKTRVVNANTGVTRHGSADIAILMLSGLRDTIVPPSHMRELWEIVRPDAKAVYSPCLVVPEDACGGEVEDSGYATVSSRRSAERQRVVAGEEGQAILTPDLIFFGASDGAGESRADLNLDSEELSTWARWAKLSSAVPPGWSEPAS